MDQFVLVLGERSAYLPGGKWQQYEADIRDGKLVCVPKGDNTVSYEIPLSDFRRAEFGIGSGNLWLQCQLEKGSLVFCSPRKSWKSEAGIRVKDAIDAVCSIVDKKAYDQMTGPLFFLHMFK